MPFSVQAKLLRFLENRKFMRVGGAEKIAVDARLICATLRPLDEEVKAGRFRADLYYRIQGITLNVPPLRARQPDRGPLVQQFLRQLAARHGSAPARMTRASFAAIGTYPWPGNIRELRNVLELVTLLRAGKQVRPRDFRMGFGGAPQLCLNRPPPLPDLSPNHRDLAGGHPGEIRAQDS